MFSPTNPNSLKPPISLPKDLILFKHPHMGLTLGAVVLDTVPGMDLYCVSRKPVLDSNIKPLLVDQGYVKDWTPCGQEIHWRLK